MKGSKVLRKAGEQEAKAGEFQGRAKGVTKCEEFHIAARPNAQVHGKVCGTISNRQTSV